MGEPCPKWEKGVIMTIINLTLHSVGEGEKMTGSMRYYLCEDEWIDQNDGSYHWQFWRGVCG